MDHAHEHDMDMDMDMGGMSMGSSGRFQPTNMAIAQLYWYFIAAVVVICVTKRCTDLGRTAFAMQKNNARSDVPSRPTNIASRLYDAMITISRELTYPQFRPFTGPFTKHFSVWSLGQTLLLLAYWTMVLVMLWSNVILSPSSDIYAYRWEIVGFRGAWISVTQLPLIYCLGGKANIISLLTGISYERLNWLHRWVAVTVFLTVIVHWSYFFREWWLADFIQDEFEMMPMVKYGFGAWAVLGWNVLTGFGFFRTKCYELWLFQHLATAGLLLWLLYIHVPSYAMYNIWLSIGFVAFDRGLRGLWSLFRNLHVSRLWKRVAGNQSLFGFNAEVKCCGDGYVSLVVKDVDFTWQAGQHVFISMPTCGIFESHPFTISNLPGNRDNSLQIYLKCHTGFTGRLRKKVEAGKVCSVRTFISGPWGNPPVSTIMRCNTLIFIASSTGAAFTVPLLEHAIKEAKFVQRVCFHWIVRHESQLQLFVPRMVAAADAARRINIDAEFRVFITDSVSPSSSSQSSRDEKTLLNHNKGNSSSTSNVSSGDSILPLEEKAVPPDHDALAHVARSTSVESKPTSTKLTGTSDIQNMSESSITFSQGRPQSWDKLLHPTIVEAEGETAIIACGGGALMADIRNYVAWISDQRAVHKGTGAQGIFLYTETYGW